MSLEEKDIVVRQQSRREELAKALSKNRTKLVQVQLEIGILTEPLNTHSNYNEKCQQLDEQIGMLRRLCAEALNVLNESPVEPRQTLRPAPPPPPHPPPRTRLNISFPRQPPPSPASSLSPQSPASRHGLSPSSSSQQIQPKEAPAEIIEANDASNQPDSNEQPWQCSMCTLQNHPLLNKCEVCDNVRILAGSVKIVPSRPPPPAPVGSRSAPQTPATPTAGPASARIMVLPSDFAHRGTTNSNSEGNLSHFVGDFIM